MKQFIRGVAYALAALSAVMLAGLMVVFMLVLEALPLVAAGVGVVLLVRWLW